MRTLGSRATWLALVAILVALGYLGWVERGTRARGDAGSTLTVSVREGEGYNVLGARRVALPSPVKCRVDGRELPVVLRTDGSPLPGDRVSFGDDGQAYYVGYFTAERTERIGLSCPVGSAWRVLPRTSTAERVWRMGAIYTVVFGALLAAATLAGPAAAYVRSARRRSTRR